MKRLLLVLSTACLALGLVGVASAQTTAGPARTRLDAFAKDLHALSGKFTQSLSGADGQPGKLSAGALSLQAPRQFRWDTLTPYQQTIVADGSRVWVYDPDLEQVTVRAQGSEEAHSPLTVITDLKQLDRDFKVVERGQRDGLAWLRLTSTAKDPQFDYADLGFDASGLARMIFRDQLGATTDIRFDSWQRNPTLAPSTFNFSPPKGTDVIGDAPVLSTQPLQN